MTESVPPRAPRRSVYLWAGIAAVAVVAAVLYGKTPRPGKEMADQCPASNAAILRTAALAKGDVAAAASPKRAVPVVALDFLRPDGAPASLETFRGRVILVNLWATWCVPCREEMPTLDRLQALAGSKDFEVVAINVDTTRLERAKEFLQTAGVSRLGFYSDPKADVFYRLKTAGKVVGLPTSILVGRDGCEIATLSGPANWASDDALALIRAAL
jgi:thiol-disulfide isomerase/thioredoxin